MTNTIRGRRLQHWAVRVDPLSGPPGLLWLRADDAWLLGLDPVTGERRVAQPLVPETPSHRYAVFEGPWPHVVVPREAPPRSKVVFGEGAAVIERGGQEIGRVALPAELRTFPFVRLGERAAWVISRPTRGKPAMRFAHLDLEGRRFGPVHELPFSTNDLAVTDQRFAAFDGPSGRAHVYEPQGSVGVLACSTSAAWGGVSLAGDEIAVVSHRRTSRGDVVAIAWATLRAGEAPALRYFALATQGATYATFVDGALAVHQYGDVTLVSRDALRAAPPGEVAFEIEDVPTAPPPPTSTAKVTYIGASTGVGLAESDVHGRLRFRCSADAPVAEGDVIALDVVERGVAERWHRLDAGKKALAEESRCLVAIPWADFADAIRDPHYVAMAEGLRAAPPVSVVPEDAGFCTAVRYGAYLSDPDVDDDTPIVDADALRTLEGRLERSGDLIDLVGDDEIDALAAELIALHPALRVGGAPSGLHLSLEFYTVEAPSDDDVAAFEAIAARLLEGGWGLNYEFEPPEDYAGCRVALDFQAIGTAKRALR